MQNTIATTISFTGTGLHSGRPVRMKIMPAAAEFGIWFKRTDLAAASKSADAAACDPMIRAHWANVTATPLCTLLRNESGASVSTVEHVMAALAGTGVHNALIEIDGPEAPILDGSAARFVHDILRAGLRRQDAPVRILRVAETVEVRNGEAWARLSPSERFEIAFAIDFEDPAIGQQTKLLDLSNGTFVRELSDARTFCRRSDVEDMRANGLALGGTLENAVVVDGDTVLTPGGLRHDDEPVRHKMLDALGDLALAGAPLMGRYTGHRAGHRLTNALLREAFATPGALKLVACPAEAAHRLPGVGVEFADLPMSA